MKCHNPRIGWRIGQHYTKDGILSPKITFSEREAIAYFTATGMLPYMDSYSMAFPCGHCVACLINKRKDWSTRLTHEIGEFDKSCFVTLTYNDDYIPTTSKDDWSSPCKLFDTGLYSGEDFIPSLCVGDVQRFIKRVRRHLEYLPKRAKNRVGRDHVTSKIRYFVVGEYGPKTHRPHYHIIIFGWSPSDVTPFFRSKSGQQVYRSAQLEKLWPYGYVTVESCGCGTAQYCAQYVTKKLTKKPSRFDSYVVPEFFRYSTRGGGIGTTWLKKYYRQCLRIDYPYVTYRNGKNIIKASIPVAYKRWIRKYRVEAYLSWRDSMVKFIQFERLEGRSSRVDWDDQYRKIAMDIHKQEEFFERCEL